MEAKKTLIVGLFVAGALLLFTIGLFMIGESSELFTKSFDVYADFSRVTAVQVGTIVRVAGMNAGAVSAIEIPPAPEGKFRVRFRIEEKLHGLVRQNSMATIQTDGLLGSKFLEVDAGSNQSKMAQNGSTIRSKEPFDLDAVMEQVGATITSIQSAVANIKGPLTDAVTHIDQTAESANQLISGATPEVESFLDQANQVAANLHDITVGVREGHGAVGELFSDEDVSRNVKLAVGDAQTSMQNLRDTTSSTKDIAGKVDADDIVSNIQASTKNLQQITQQVKDAVAKFQTSSGKSGASENFDKTMADAQRSMSNLSQDTEAMKHSFLLRGFFKKRGFYNLNSVSASAYKAGKFGRGFQRHTVALDGGELFIKDAVGVEELSDAGKRDLDRAMVAILALPQNGALIVEGYALGGSDSDEYLHSRSRAVLVQTYLTNQFHLRADYVGVVAMGNERSTAGVNVVSFFKN